MVEASELLDILSSLERLLDRITEDHVRESDEYRAALNQVLAALNLTKAYIADQTKGRSPDRQRELQLSLAWTRAAGSLQDIDPDLSEKCRLEGEQWANPTSWEAEELEDAQRGIDEAAVRMRTLLTS